MKLGANDLEQREDGWSVWGGLVTEDAEDVEITAPKLHVSGSVKTGGGFTSRGTVVVEGSVMVGGSIRCADYLIVGGAVVSGGDIEVGDDLTAGGRTRCYGDLSVKGALRPGGDLAARSVKARILFWGAMHPPRVPPEACEAKAVWPTECTREYWSERLGVELKEDFWALREILKPGYAALVGRDDLTPTERWIIESNRAYAER